MTGQLTVADKLAAHKWLSDMLTALRRDELDPEAVARLRVGARHSVTFSEDPDAPIAAWVSVPKPSSSATVTDPAKLLAWARDNATSHVQTVAEVVVCDALIDHLREHAPQFLRETSRCEPQWVEDVLAGLKARGYIADYNGEKHTDIPGITAGTGRVSPRVELTPDAPAVIRQAWQDGRLSVPSLLALPQAPAAQESGPPPRSADQDAAASGSPAPQAPRRPA